MAMTFTLVSHLREQLSTLVQSREARRKLEESEKERLALEVWVVPQMVRTMSELIDVYEGGGIKNSRHTRDSGVVQSMEN